MKIALLLILLLCASSTWAATIDLLPSGSLGVVCGTLKKESYVAAFGINCDVLGYSHIWTTCSQGGKGAKTLKYQKWYSTRWAVADGSILESTALTVAPSVDTSLVVADINGNIAYTKKDPYYYWKYTGVLITP